MAVTPSEVRLAFEAALKQSIDEGSDGLTFHVQLTPAKLTGYDDRSRWRIASYKGMTSYAELFGAVCNLGRALNSLARIVANEPHTGERVKSEVNSLGFSIATAVVFAMGVLDTVTKKIVQENMVGKKERTVNKQSPKDSEG